MSTPEMPWYPAMEKGLRPLAPFSSLLLIGLAILTLYIAVKGDAVMRLAWLVYLISP